MHKQKKEPDRIIRAGGREFYLYREYDEAAKTYTLIYPEFAENPQYTADGRPFSTAEREGCPYYTPPTPDGPDSDDCGGCGYFHREEPYAIIGVCMCEERRKKDAK